MNKDLEALKELKHWKETNNENGVVWLPLFAVEDIEKALLELKTIKEAKPSEAFECSLKLYKMVESAGNDNGFNLNEAWKYHNIIKQALLKAQELEKENEFLSNTIITVNNGYTSLMSNYQEQKQVLKIIKEKNVDIIYLKESNNVEEYNSHFSAVVCKLTPEEYELLKEVLK